MKTINVKLHHIDDGRCMEVYKVEPETDKPARYVCRDTTELHEWYWLCDAPYGSCERDYHCADDILIIVCDKEWNPILSTGNDRTLFPASFLTLEELCRISWNNIKENYPGITKKGFDEWILNWSSKPFKYEVDKDNWKTFDQKIIKEEIIYLFDYLGQKKAIYRHTVHHTRCDAVWYEYYAGNIQREKYDYFDQFFGYQFNINEVVPNTAQINENHKNELISDLTAALDYIEEDIPNICNDDLKRRAIEAVERLNKTVEFIKSL